MKGRWETVGDPLQASNAWAMGNVGLSTVLRDESDVSGYDEEDFGVPTIRPSWLLRFRGRAIRWVFAAGVVLAFVNHWPGGR
jgi:hypothetical protein